MELDGNRARSNRPPEKCPMSGSHVRRPPDIERFWANVSPEPMSGCWLWTGLTNTKGYGRVYFGAGHYMAHRWIYEREIGPIPEGLQLDHKCRVPCCVNPEHLRPVTPQENTLLGISPAAVNAGKTHCSRGHEYTPQNIYYSLPSYNRGRLKRGGRRCRICARDFRTIEARRAVS